MHADQSAAACAGGLHVPECHDVYDRMCTCIQVSEEVFCDLERFGQRLCDEVDALGRQAELEPPQLR